MIYHGETLCITFLIHDESGDRYTFVSNERGGCLVKREVSKVHHLEIVENYRRIGTWPVAEHPEDVWKR